ncbi:MAG TPA: TetR/AcrR family transcriptional regulator [Chloroflexota bacterium]|nr:TetR/AcrR family transcriptional regulator [Chloroflexota bacterium]
MGKTEIPSPPPRAMRADARRNEGLLLTAAAAAFAEHGSDASLDDIARRAGVGIGTLYRHFPTRQALAMAVYRDYVVALGAQARELLAFPSPEEALGIWLRAVAAYGATKRGLAEFLQASMREGESEMTWCKEEMHAAGSALLIRAQQAGTVRPDADISDLLRLAQGIAWASDTAPDGIDRTDRFFSIVMDGLRRQEPTEK